MSIEIKNLTKQFGSNKALDNVNLTFEEHKIYGLLGRNGAGKSTLLNIISNRLFADTGSVFINGMPAQENDEAQKQIYLMSERDLYPMKMKIKDIFRWSKEFYPTFDMDFAMNLAEQFELNVKKEVRALSTGFGSIYKLIVALSVNTPYVFLDEPVLGLDANNRDLFYRVLIERYSAHPATYVLSTHLIEEISTIIEEIVIIKHGSIIRNESRDELLSKGYTVSGPAALVDQYCIGKNVIGMDTLGGLKSSYIMGLPNRVDLPNGLELGKLDLQKLFVKLTNS